MSVLARAQTTTSTDVAVRGVHSTWQLRGWLIRHSWLWCCRTAYYYQILLNCSISTSTLYRYRSFSQAVMQSLVLILTRLDYGNATLAGLADQSLVKLMSVLNAAARLIFMIFIIQYRTDCQRMFWHSVLNQTLKVNYATNVLLSK